MKKIYALLFCLSVFTIGQAQSFDPYVIGSSGTFASSASGSMAWTVGEVMTKTYSSAGNFFTQGFHQPVDTVFIDVIADISTQNISIFPNPVVDNLVIDFSSSSGNYSIEIINMQGQLLRTETVSSGQKRLGISFYNFANGVYLLNIVNVETHSRNSYKINKTE
jgi:hypothetical protein